MAGTGWQCIICGLRYRTAYDLGKHVVITHSEGGEAYKGGLFRKGMGKKGGNWHNHLTDAITDSFDRQIKATKNLRLYRDTMRSLIDEHRMLRKEADEAFRRLYRQSKGLTDKWKKMQVRGGTMEGSKKTGYWVKRKAAGMS